MKKVYCPTCRKKMDFIREFPHTGNTMKLEQTFLCPHCNAEKVVTVDRIIS